MGAIAITRDDILREVIRSVQVCHVGMVDLDGKPYVLPFNFGVDEQFIWLHSAREGKKNTILRKNPSVCIAFSSDYQLGFRHEHVACSYFMKYKSVLVFGDVEFVEDYDLKVYGMNVIMKHYTGKEFSYNPPAINNVEIFRVKLEHITGREYR